jgi:hypothetical protein
VEDEGLRNRVALNAYKDVKGRFNLDYMVDRWMEVLR